MAATSTIACSKANSRSGFDAGTFWRPETLRMNWRDAASISSAVGGGSRPRSSVMLRHMPATLRRTVRAMTAAVLSADPVRPRWRGVIHRWAAITLAPVFVVLVLAAPDQASRIAVAINGVGVVGMFAVSATYHSGRLSPEATRVFKRIDHAMILLAIAGTYTAVTVLALDGADQARMLWIVGVSAAVGVAIRMVWLDAPYPVTAAVYLVVGWSALFDLPAYIAGTTAVEMALIVAGGLVYTVAGVVYALHRPVLSPEVFGYHELFHALTVVGALCHIAAVALLL